MQEFGLNDFMHQMQAVEPLPELMDVSIVIPCPATGQIPSQDDFPGVYDFQLEVVQDIKRQAWQYSALLKKAFIKVGCSMLVKFKMTPNRPLPQGLYIRAVAVFTDPPEAVFLPVLRCPVHKHSITDPINSGYQHLNHVVSCSDTSAVYDVNPESNRHSVCVNLKGPQPGTDWEIFTFAMMCRSSCDGFSRRPLALIFTLEKGLEVFGRRVLPIRVCAAPKRDCTNEEARFNAEVSAEATPVQEPKEELQNLLPDGQYLVPVFHKDDYATLVQFAKELAEKDYAEGPEKVEEVQRFENILNKLDSTNF